MDIDNHNKNGLEYTYNELYKGQNPLLNFSSLISFFGGRNVISDFYNNRRDLLCNPFVKIVILFAVIFMNIKNFKLSILLFFLYILFLDNYVSNENECDKKDMHEDNTHKIQ